jgi:hypothetical protein
MSNFAKFFSLQYWQNWQKLAPKKKKDWSLETKSSKKRKGIVSVHDGFQWLRSQPCRIRVWWALGFVDSFIRRAFRSCSLSWQRARARERAIELGTAPAAPLLSWFTWASTAIVSASAAVVIRKPVDLFSLPLGFLGLFSFPLYWDTVGAAVCREEAVSSRELL